VVAVGHTVVRAQLLGAPVDRLEIVNLEREVLELRRLGVAREEVNL
jgi:hypothetical protein